MNNLQYDFHSANDQNKKRHRVVPLFILIEIISNQDFAEPPKQDSRQSLNWVLAK